MEMINTFLSLHLALFQNSHMGPRGFQFIEQNGINFSISYSCGLMLGDSGQKWKLEPLCFFSLWLVQGWNNFPEEMFLSPGTNSHLGQVNQICNTRGNEVSRKRGRNITKPIWPSCWTTFWIALSAVVSFHSNASDLIIKLAKDSFTVIFMHRE